ncbi:mitochondrial FAD carrier protein flx1 [Lithohypha guttulata]|uniref:Mitochondrial FAD carrier protein flx1 n=1 Tax=Lithohypha guttulata TaxID=1690604 RepID=A0AAN7YK40_9EURO|nr:mitochondrial FAD carrier protein flx1 [Lithohypha guttulata]KAK5090016.1 mitochondrial FAD carrier protein flx1 [Lithohypha guttulata]KAK5099167.1 mitochondrial FAD carrier protein flx1 [Lithohypha guttulata]
MPQDGRRISPATVETIAGLTAGLASTIIVHPLDIIKTRMQLDTSPNPLLNSSRSVAHDILRNEGPTRIRALYRGLSPNLLGNASGWALYFLWYKQGQDLVRSLRAYPQNKALTNVDYLLASAGAGALSAVLTNPIWVVKTRMISTSSATEGAYPSMIAGIRSIWRTEGIRGFFHGLIPALFGVSHGALYFLAYENLKIWQRAKRQDQQLSNMDTAIASALSKVFAGTITYPSQVVRSRLQRYDPGAKIITANPGFIRVTTDLWRNESILGFYKGLGPNLARVVPSTCVTFLVYENTRWALPRLFNEDSTDTKTVL